MLIGIVSRCLRENKKRFFLRPEIYRLSDEMIAAEIPFSLLENRSERRVEKAVRKARWMLKNAGAEKIIFERELSKWSENVCDKSEMFYKFAPQAVLCAAKRFTVKPPISVAIRQKNPDYKCFFVIKRLIYDCNDIRILTDKAQKGSRICDKIMEEYGAAVQILPYNFVFFGGITADLDENKICVLGNSVLTDFEPETENFGYNIDPIELFAAQNGNFDEMIIKSCRCGKNKLTLRAF